MRLKKFLADDKVYVYGRAVFKVFPPVNLNDCADFDAAGEFAPEIVSGFGVESAGFAQNNAELAAFFSLSSADSTCRKPNLLELFLVRPPLDENGGFINTQSGAQSGARKSLMNSALKAVGAKPICSSKKRRRESISLVCVLISPPLVQTAKLPVPADGSSTCSRPSKFNK